MTDLVIGAVIAAAVTTVVVVACLAGIGIAAIAHHNRKENP